MSHPTNVPSDDQTERAMPAGMPSNMRDQRSSSILLGNSRQTEYRSTTKAVMENMIMERSRIPKNELNRHRTHAAGVRSDDRIKSAEFFANFGSKRPEMETTYGRMFHNAKQAERTKTAQHIGQDSVKFRRRKYSVMDNIGLGPIRNLTNRIGAVDMNSSQISQAAEPTKEKPNTSVDSEQLGEQCVQEKTADNHSEKPKDIADDNSERKIPEAAVTEDLRANNHELTTTD